MRQNGWEWVRELVGQSNSGSRQDTGGGEGYKPYLCQRQIHLHTQKVGDGVVVAGEGEEFEVDEG